MDEYKTNILLKKNVILIPADYDGNSNQKGVLTLEYKKDKVLGSIRCYNLKPTDEIFSIGVQVGDSTFKTQATSKQLANLKLEIKAVANNASKINCVIVKLNGQNYSTLLWGSTEITKTMAESYFVQSLLEKTQILAMQAKPLEQTTIAQSIEQKQEEIFEDEMLENYIDKVVASTSDECEQKTNVVQQDKSNEHTFFDSVEHQVNMLFDTNEADLELEKIIPDSKFCKVQNGEEFYVFGVIYQQNKPRCICYGIPAEYSSVPPAEVDGFCQWLPLDSNNYQGKGYWLTYQDAISGENIVVELVS